jgi:hypothetical protein
MDPIEVIAKPSILEHLPIFLGLGTVIFGALYLIIKRLFGLYNAAKQFVSHAVDEKMPNAVVTALEDRAPAIFDKVVAERLAKHEEVEELKLENALGALKIQFDNDREIRDEKLANHLAHQEEKLAIGVADRSDKLSRGQDAIMDKLSGVDNRVQVVQLRLESHEARLSAVEQVVRGPLKRVKPKKR